MGILDKPKGWIDEFAGTMRKMRQPKRQRPFDKMQGYMAIGEYQVGAEQGTPN